MRPVALQMPMNEEQVVELGRQVFRKQCLRPGTLNYKGRTLRFDRPYFDAVAKAFREQAYDTVPFVLADADNRHTQDPLRSRGEVVGLEAADDGLYATVSLTEDAAALVRDNPKLGVSVRIVEHLERDDGKTFSAACQHLLGTFDPRISGMAPWEPVALSADMPVIDLSALTFADDSTKSTYDFADGEDTPDDEETVMADQPSAFTDEETARLRALLAQLDTTPTDPPADDGYMLPSDEELAEIAAGLFDEEDEDAPAEVAASSDNDALELANSRLDAQAIELAQMRAERDAERYERLRTELATAHGIPPAITELARPLLLGSHVVELANGGQVDAGEVMRKVLTAVGEHVKLVDLSSDTVFDTSGAADAQAEAKAREDAAAAYRREYGL